MSSASLDAFDGGELIFDWYHGVLQEYLFHVYIFKWIHEKQKHEKHKKTKT